MNILVTGRSCRVHVPASYRAGTPLPLVVLLHPLGADGPTFENMTGFSVLAEAKGFIAAYPDGTPTETVQALNLPTTRAWNSGGGFAPGCTGDDTGFIDTILTDLATRYTIDQTRTYLVGMSNGGMLAYRVAAAAADRFAAMASVAGVMTVPAWAPATPMPVLHIHGTADRIAPHAGGGLAGFLSVAQNMARVAAHNGITAGPVTVPLTPAVPADPAVTRFDYPGASGPREDVVLYEVIGGGHTWPGRPVPSGFPASVGASTANLDATGIIWDFLRRFTRP